MNSKAFCRIGVFYDGSYFMYAQRFFYHHRKIGWLDFHAFHKLIENYVRVKEQGYTNYRIVYASWFQGMFHGSQSTQEQLKFDRNYYHDLMHAGIEPKYLPVSQSGKGEKGADVALAIDAMQIGLEGKLDIVVLVTGDGDFVPLMHHASSAGCKIEAATFGRSASSMLKEVVSEFIDFDKDIARYVIKQKPRPGKNDSIKKEQALPINKPVQAPPIIKKEVAK